MNKKESTALPKLTKIYEQLVNMMKKDYGYNTPIDKQNLKESPQRIAKGFMEIIKPKAQVTQEVKDILKKSFDSQYNGMVVSHDNLVYSMCPHHFLIVAYKVTLAYIPLRTGSVLGVSKLTRLAQVLASRPVLQETFTSDLASVLSINNKEHSSIFGGIQSEGSAVTVEGMHFCMACRGVRNQNSRIVTQNMLGAFRNDAIARNEYMQLVASRRPESIL